MVREILTDELYDEVCAVLESLAEASLSDEGQIQEVTSIDPSVLDMVLEGEDELDVGSIEVVARGGNINYNVILFRDGDSYYIHLKEEDFW